MHMQGLAPICTGGHGMHGGPPSHQPAGIHCCGRAAAAAAAAVTAGGEAEGRIAGQAAAGLPS